MKTPILVIVLSSLLFTGCMTTPALPDEQRPQHWATSINKTHNFYQVAPQLFRSEQPNTTFISQLKQHNIQTIINLRQSNDDAKLLDAQQYNLFHIPIATWKISREDILQVMLRIRDAQQRGENVLIHCYHGSDRTGATIAMYRILFENWTIEQATQEMKHGGYGFHAIWKNIERLFTEENIQWLREQLQQSQNV